MSCSDLVLLRGELMSIDVDVVRDIVVKAKIFPSYCFGLSKHNCRTTMFHFSMFSSKFHAIFSSNSKSQLTISFLVCTLQTR